MDFMIDFPISRDWKGDSYNTIFVIMDCLIKMANYELVETTIDASRLARIIINMLVKHYGFPKLIVSDQSLLFILKF